MTTAQYEPAATATTPTTTNRNRLPTQFVLLRRSHVLLPLLGVPDPLQRRWSSITHTNEDEGAVLTSVTSSCWLPFLMQLLRRAHGHGHGRAQRPLSVSLPPSLWFPENDNDETTVPTVNVPRCCFTNFFFPTLVLPPRALTLILPPRPFLAVPFFFVSFSVVMMSSDIIDESKSGRSRCIAVRSNSHREPCPSWPLWCRQRIAYWQHCRRQPGEPS